MTSHKYTIGVDYGTESGRAVLVDVTSGQEIASAVHPYGDGVIDEHLPGSDTPLPPDFALQNPQNYIDVLVATIPQVLAAGKVRPDDVIGIGTDANRYVGDTRWHADHRADPDQDCYGVKFAFYLVICWFLCLLCCLVCFCSRIFCHLKLFLQQFNYFI